MTIRHRGCAIALASVGFVVTALLSIAPKALATEFIVNSTADSTECATTCTLRGAIAAADLSSEPANTVIVPSGTYVFGPAEEAHPGTTGELRVSNPSGTTLTIRGAGLGATVIDAESQDRVMRISGGGADVLEDMTLEKGFQHSDEPFSAENVRGAGIYQVGGELTLEDMRLTNNRNNGYGGGVDVEAGGRLTLKDSELDHEWTSVGGGGGVSMEPGTLTVTNTTFDHDTSAAGEGGAVQLLAGSSGSFANATFADDGILETGLTYEGGAAYLEKSSASFTNVTFAGDVAGGNKGGGSDISSNEGSHVSLTNVLLGPTQEDPLDQACAGSEVGITGAWQDLGGNLSTEETCALAPADMGVQLGFGEFGFNGGSTPTVALLADSPAIDIGVSGCPSTDQRGYPRSGRCDSGAFEYEPPTGSPPGGSSGTPSTSTSSTPPAPTTAVASTPKAIEEVLLGCGSSPLVLHDVYIKGSRVLISGSAAKRFVGKKVEILFNDARRVAGATVQANGVFTTTAPLPPAKIRDALSTRYSANIGRIHSGHLKLVRRLLLQPPTASGTTVTLTGQVKPPLTKPIAPITVEEQLECGKVTIAKTFLPQANGHFHVTVNVPANAKAGLFRLKSSVAANQHSTKRGFATFSLPLPVVLG